ncbi:uncharacterized protein LOC124891240 [Capsicum annuum]|uniref:uncharacterized protein LOC124891240 n=1 Tax=Capsicum annuum TaxID=4072 RepID=UPI001FB109AF|nr:uncharacterized protein LOC124891240 [Capsicum annuum]
MAEGTRWKLTDEKLARHDEMLADLLNSQQEVKNIQVGIQGILELILDRLGALERGPAGQNIGIGLLSNPAQDVRKRHPPTPILPPKWELPQFEGHEPKLVNGRQGLKITKKKATIVMKPRGRVVTNTHQRRETSNRKLVLMD